MFINQLGGNQGKVISSRFSFSPSGIADINFCLAYNPLNKMESHFLSENMARLSKSLPFGGT